MPFYWSLAVIVWNHYVIGVISCFLQKEVFAQDDGVTDITLLFALKETWTVNKLWNCIIPVQKYWNIGTDENTK
jgi:hypothetical protein